MKALFAVCVFVVCAPRGYAAVNPISADVKIVACASSSSEIGESGFCYAYDLVNGQSALEVTVAAGVKVQAGMLMVGGEAKALVKVTMSFPLGTSRQEALRSAEAVLKKQLAGKEVRDELEELDLKYEKVGKIRKVTYCEEEDEMTALLKKALGEAAEDVLE